MYMNPKICIRVHSSTSTYPSSLYYTDVTDWIFGDLMVETPHQMIPLDVLEKPSIVTDKDLTANTSANVEYLGSEKIDYNFKSIECTNAEYQKLKHIMNATSVDIIMFDDDILDKFRDDLKIIVLKDVKPTLKVTHQSNDWSTLEVYGSTKTRYATNHLEINDVLKDI